MGKGSWIRIVLCLLAALVLLCAGLALAEGGTEGPSVALRVNGEESAAELMFNEYAEVTISAHGATAMRFMISDDNWLDLDAWDEWEEWNQNTDDWNICFGWDRWEGPVCVQACFDEDPSAQGATWIRSNTVEVSATNLGDLSIHTISFPESVKRGELLEVQVSDLDEHAEWTYVDVSAEETIFYMDHMGDLLYIPTAQLEPGTYSISVGSWAVGYNDALAEGQFTVVEPDETFAPDEGGVYWAFNQTEEVTTHQGVYFSAYAFGSNVSRMHVEVVRSETGDLFGIWDGGNLISDWFGTDRDGTYDFTAYLYEEGSEEPFAESSFTMVVSARGDLACPQVSIPRKITLLQDLEGSIQSVEGAERYAFNFAINRDGEWEWFENHDQDASDATIAYDGHYFDEVGLYRLVVGAHATGMNSSYTECYLVVNPEEDEMVALTVGGARDEIDCVAHTQLPLVISAPGGTNVQYFNGYGWNDFGHRENSIGYSGSESFDGGDTTVLARAWFDELGEWRYSSPVTVHAEITAEVGEINLSLNTQEVNRGDALVATFEAAAHAQWYDLRIRNQYGDEYYCFRLDPGVHSLPTAMLDPGAYCVTVNYGGTGCDWKYVEQPFTVTEGINPEGIIASLSANEIGCNQRVILSVYAPGANRIRIYNETNPNPDEWFDERDGETYLQEHNWNHPETMHFTAAVSYDEGESWSDRVEIGALRVIESPQLSSPEIEMTSTLFEAGDSVSFSFKPVENTTVYWYELRDNDMLGGNDYLMDGWFYEPANVTLPASLFRAGHTYKLDVHVGAPGFETSDACYGFAVRPDLVDGDITLNVNGETASAEGWASDGFRVVADAPENATAIIVSDGMNWRWQPGSHFEDDFGYDFNGQVTLIARYTIDEIDLDAPWWETAGWAGYSNPITLTIHSYGNMPEVEADVPASVTRGDFLRIPVTNAETFLSGEYADLWLHAEAGIPEEGRWYGCYDWDGDGAILLPTVELEAGRTYELHVRAGARGWIGSTHVYEFSVLEPVDGGIRFAIDKTQVVTFEDFVISVYAPGAEQVKIFVDNGEMDCRDGDAYSESHCRGDAGVYSFHAEVYDSETDAWTATDSIEVNVNAPDGDLTAEEIHLQMDTRLAEGQELAISWDDVGLRHYDVRIERLRDGQCVWHSWNDHGETSLNVPVVMPEELNSAEHVMNPGEPILEAGEFYRVNLDFQRYGSNSLHLDRQIVVMSDDMFAEGLALRVSGETEAVSVLVNTDVFVEITAPENTTAILAWNGYGWDFYEDNRVETCWGWGDANTFMLYARYTTDTIEEGKDWMEYEWSRVSNIVNVTTTSYGKLPELEADVPASVTRGDFLRIAITNAETFLNGEYGNLWLHAEAYSPEEGRWYGCYDWDGNGTILLPTGELEAGRTYELHVRVGAPGYGGSENVFHIDVTEPENGGILFAIDKAEVETCEFFTVSVFAPNADEVRIYNDGHEFDRREGSNWYVGTHWRHEAGDFVINARVHYPDDTWVQTSDITLHVNASGAQLTAEEVNLSVPSQLAAGNDLTVSWADAGLYHYDLEVSRLSDGWCVWHNWNVNGETSMTVPAVMPDASEGMEQMLVPGETVLTAGEVYEVTLFAYRQGSNSLQLKKQVLVAEEGMFDGQILLTMNGSTNDLTWPVNVAVPVLVTAPGNATAILLWNGYGWEWYDGNRVETDIAWGDAVERLVYARYTTNPNADRYSDWNYWQWIGTSNVVTVKLFKNGDAPVPEVELSDANPLRGDVISFTVQNADAFNGFNWTVRDELDGFEWEWRDWEGNVRHEIDTFSLESDHSYLLCVNNYGSEGMASTGVEIPFSVRVNGQADAPEVDVADTVACGDLLNVRILNPESGDRFRAWFLVNWSDSYAHVEWDGQSPINMTTFELEPGCENILLYVVNEGSYGIDRNYTILPITVTEPSGNLSLYVEKTDLVTQEDTRIVAYASGAEHIYLTARTNDDSSDIIWEAETYGELCEVWQNFTGRAGAKLLTARAVYPDGSIQTQSVDINVTAPEGDLSEPVIDMPDSVEPGEDLNFSVYAKDAEWWFVEVFDQTAEEGQPMYHWDVEDYEESRAFTVPAADLVDGHSYGIGVYAARYGWNETYAYREFIVSAQDDPYAENVMRLPTALSEIEDEAFEGIFARTVVIPEGTTRIGARAFADCSNLKYVEIPNSVTSIADDAFAGSTVTFICNDDSAAWEFAQEHGISVR